MYGTLVLWIKSLLGFWSQQFETFRLPAELTKCITVPVSTQTRSLSELSCRSWLVKNVNFFLNLGHKFRIRYRYKKAVLRILGILILSTEQDPYTVFWIWYKSWFIWIILLADGRIWITNNYESGSQRSTNIPIRIQNSAIKYRTGNEISIWTR